MRLLQSGQVMSAVALLKNKSPRTRTSMPP
jgi:hypothetical protein